MDKSGTPETAITYQPEAKCSVCQNVRSADVVVRNLDITGSADPGGEIMCTDILPAYP